MQFNTTKLAGHRVLVTGAEAHQSVVLNSSEWDWIKQEKAVAQAGADYDAAVEAFFAPLIAATEKANAAAAPVVDEAFFVVIDEGSEGSEHVCREVRELSYESVILRMIESGDTSRLIWVGNCIEVLAADEVTTEADVQTGDEVILEADLPF